MYVYAARLSAQVNKLIFHSIHRHQSKHLTKVSPRPRCHEHNFLNWQCVDCKLRVIDYLTPISTISYSAPRACILSEACYGSCELLQDFLRVETWIQSFMLIHPLLCVCCKDAHFRLWTDIHSVMEQHKMDFTYFTKQVFIMRFLILYKIWFVLLFL